MTGELTDALRFVKALQTKLQEQKCSGISEQLTFSGGICPASEECYLTGTELRAFANFAERVAKQRGGQKILIFRDGKYREKDLFEV